MRGLNLSCLVSFLCCAKRLFLDSAYLRIKLLNPPEKKDIYVMRLDRFEHLQELSFLDSIDIIFILNVRLISKLQRLTFVQQNYLIRFGFPFC